MVPGTIKLKMSFLKDIFTKKEEPIKSYKDFWFWFQKNEKTFFKAVKNNNNIEKIFFEKLSQKLSELKDGFYYMTGMLDDNTAELVLTPDGNIKNIVFVEELVNSAPQISGWKITSLKPALDIQGFSIKMEGYTFSSDSLFFYSNDHLNFPDLIDITVVHGDFKEEDHSVITKGVFIYLDNYLGELDFATTIDNINVIGTNEAQKDLIPIEKLKDFLIWRQKEFIEKYDGLRYNTENDSYSNLESEMENGRHLLAVFNSTLLEWNNLASHSWIMVIEIKYDGEDFNGMPEKETYNLLNKFGDDLNNELKDHEGYLNIGRQTGNNSREIYFACKEFRKPSIVLNQLTIRYGSKLEISYDIYKDKYWETFNKFRQNLILE